MIIYFGADHRGYQLKEVLKAFIAEKGYEVVDMGATTINPQDDYPDFASVVSRKIAMEPDAGRGILVCASGAGMDITANKHKGVRSVLGLNPDQVYQARHDDDVNVLTLASDYTDEEAAKKMVLVFLNTSFGQDQKYQRRIAKIPDGFSDMP